MTEYTLEISSVYCEIINKKMKACPFLRSGERHDHVEGRTHKIRYEFCSRYNNAPIDEARKKCTMFEIIVRDK
jgi:hypothetical protein